VSATIVTARGDLDQVRAAEVLDFLTRDGDLNEEAARRWLSELVCVARDDGRVVGVSAARPATVALIGGRPFWIHRCVMASGSDERWAELFNAAFEILAHEFEEGEVPYVGVCALVDDPDLMRRRPEAIWPGTELMFAGYLDDGRQVRIRYFWGAAIGPALPNSPSIDETRGQEYPLEDRYEILALEKARATAEDVIELWLREDAMTTVEDARERVTEVSLVAVERDGGVAGVSTVYLQRNEQLRMNLWHYRTYVAEPHRLSNIAAQLIFRNRDLLEERFVRGVDTRAPGVLFELENPGMREYFNKALWLPADFTFIGENELGAHVRVHYFPGAEVPLPAASLD
jgi:hypothetical protein